MDSRRIYQGDGRFHRAASSGHRAAQATSRVALGAGVVATFGLDDHWPTVGVLNEDIRPTTLDKNRTYPFGLGSPTAAQAGEDLTQRAS